MKAPKYISIGYYDGGQVPFNQLKEGDEIAIHFGAKRQRTTDYIVIETENNQKDETVGFKLQRKDTTSQPAV